MILLQLTLIQQSPLLLKNELLLMQLITFFRAVLLTSLTTFVGLLPLLFEKSTQAQFLIPMAISLGFGILFATFISLLLIPCHYLILDDIKQLLKTKRRRQLRQASDAI